MPLHHIDTSVILELPEKTEDDKCCKRYMQKASYNFMGKISFPALSELFALTMGVKDSNKQHAFLDAFADLIDVRKLEFYAPENIYETAIKIKKLDTRLKTLDTDIIACAIEDKAVNLVTLDQKLIGHRSIEAEFGLKIIHPRDLL